MNETMQKMDEIFAEERAVEAVPANEAMGLIGSVVRKMATDSAMDLAEVKASMQRVYLLTKQVEAWLAEDSDEETVGVPVALLASIRKDSEGPDAEVVPISVAMELVKKRLTGDESKPTPVAKNASDPVVWGADLAAPDDAPTPESWGADPADLAG